MKQGMLKSVVYWVATGLFAVGLFMSGVMYLTRADAVAQAIAHLGYPPYLMFILGTAKVLGVAALLQPRMPTLRQWAYAGFTFNLLGAAASHLFAGDPFTMAAIPLTFLVILACSYVFGQRLRGGAMGAFARA